MFALGARIDTNFPRFIMHNFVFLFACRYCRALLNVNRHTSFEIYLDF
jgi:hypothetical protein